MTKIKKQPPDDKQQFLPNYLDEIKNNEINTEPKFSSPAQHPIWTENKAKLIERYLRFFCYITKHGTYIDGFAGPQKPDLLEMWSARLVLEDKPKRLKHFYLFECDKDKIPLLEDLKSTSLISDVEDKTKRTINIEHGDCNRLIPQLLNKKVISEKEATFCLLDQRTFECHWSTVEALAKYPKSDYKIELFYFLAECWFDRAMSETTDLEKLEKWWGNKDYNKLREMKGFDRAMFVCNRMKSELGYKSVKPWSILSKKEQGRVMYFMLHATDHPDGPGLMNRAYKQAVMPRETPEQLSFMFEQEGIALQS